MRTTEPPTRVCIINDDRYPSRWTNTQQTIKTAAALAAVGTQVELVIPRPPRAWFTSNETRKQDLESYYGVRATFELTQLPGFPWTRLKLDEAVHGVLASLYSIVGGHDVVYSRKIVPIVVALATGQRVVFESHRLLRQHYPMAYRAVKLLMHHPRFLGVVTNAQLIADAFVDMGFPPEAIAIAHNCYDPADLEPRLSIADARAQIGQPIGRPLVCYAGHIQKRKGIATIVAMAARTPDVHYIVCGGFPRDVMQAQAMATAAGATNMTFTGWVDLAGLSPYLYAADVLLIPPTAAPLRTYGNTVLPIKTYTYMATGRAILAPRQEDITEVLEHGRNAWLVEPDDLDAAVEGIRHLCDNRALSEALAGEALTDSARYTWAARATNIREFIAQRLAATTVQRSSVRPAGFG